MEDAPAVSLRFTLEKPVVRHGDDGDRPRARRTRACSITSRRAAASRGACWSTAHGSMSSGGSGWYDHEFGDKKKAGHGYQASVGWNWLSAQLDNGYDVSAYDLFDRESQSRSHGRWVIVVGPSGERHAYDDFTFERVGLLDEHQNLQPVPDPLSPGDSARRYRTGRRGGAARPGSRDDHLASRAFWEGRVRVRGTVRGAPVAGLGFVERSGASVVESTDDFFASVGRETRRAIEALLPEHPTREQARRSDRRRRPRALRSTASISISIRGRCCSRSAK